MSSLGGLTEGPPHTLSAHQLVVAWLDGYWDGERWREQETEWAAADGSFMYRTVVVDLDYEMGYLFHVTAPDGRTVDHLAAFVRHGKHPTKGWNVDVDWHRVPLTDRSGLRGWAAAGHHWFVDWVSARTR